MTNVFNGIIQLFKNLGGKHWLLGTIVVAVLVALLTLATWLFQVVWNYGPAVAFDFCGEIDFWTAFAMLMFIGYIKPQVNVNASNPS